MNSTSIESAINPKNRYKLFHSGVFWVFLIVFCVYLPILLSAARSTDEQLHGTVSMTEGDDSLYQMLAINLLYGKGFTQGYILPLETYHFDLTSPRGLEIREYYEAYGPDAPETTFYVSPGFPALLAAVYAIFGNQTLVARQMLAILAWLTALLTFLTGIVMDGKRGALAGGIVGLIFVNGYVLFRPRDPFLGSIMTEGPATFSMVLFGFLIVSFLVKHQLRYLVLAAPVLVGFIFVRPNYLLAIPLLILYLIIRFHNMKKNVIVFAIIVLSPIVAWIIYASVTTGKLVGFTAHSENAFATSNNWGVLEGVGPEHLKQGEWNPGWEIDEHGNIINTGRNNPKPGESGWAQGLTFWKDNIAQLPRLFFVKLRVGFWYSERSGVMDQMRVRLYSLSLGFLFLAVGLRPPVNRLQIFPKISSQTILFIQLGLVAFLFLIGNLFSYSIVLLAFLLVLTIALLRPYGDVYHLDFPTNWFLCFVLNHAIITLIFIGIRYHQPLDPFLFLHGILGSIIVFDELVLRRRFGVVLDSQLAG